MNSLVEVTTALGSFRFELLEDQAPRTSDYFRSAINAGRLAETSVFRIVGPRNHQPGEPHPIHVVQMGPRHRIEAEHDPVPHESTSETGLRHRKGTVSAARVNLNYLFDSFFVCMRDEPVLDHGAKRHPDGQGFAAFGQVVSGFDTLENIMARAEEGDFLKKEIPIQSIRVIEPGAAGGPADD